eukprot:CAMPEP_0185794030 /NCGR_PEP_ID=MMETSP1174-20130828/159794_1 /TAXON_ID=35687 /ORGANISM="Dictyocha speculum, Strain CCMP1381" /LENGTH=146 /DNA_ID=CAMNT_0028489229 /DNA_START=1129 /DNA_END=1569 /DNA_ORIENTATION=+
MTVKMFPHLTKQTEEGLVKTSYSRKRRATIRGTSVGEDVSSTASEEEEQGNWNTASIEMGEDASTASEEEAQGNWNTASIEMGEDVSKASEEEEQGTWNTASIELPTAQSIGDNPNEMKKCHSPFTDIDEKEEHAQDVCQCNAFEI